MAQQLDGTAVEAGVAQKDRGGIRRRGKVGSYSWRARRLRSWASSRPHGAAALKTEIVAHLRSTFPARIVFSSILGVKRPAHDPRPELPQASPSEATNSQMYAVRSVALMSACRSVSGHRGGNLV
jgi:hypothetical protein